MLNYIIKRIIASVITLWVVITITFLLIHTIPGGPFDFDRNLPEIIKKSIEERYNLNRPIWWQYQDYLKNLVKFDLGPSFSYEGMTVNQLIHNGFPISAQLGVSAIILSMVIGIPFGIVSALRQGKWQDRFVMFLATLGITIPSFVLATLLLYFFTLKIPLFPPISWGTAAHFVLPSIALAGGPTSMISRLTRSSLLEVIRQDYIRTARAKGLTDRVVIYKHALKNAIIPVLTYLGPLIAGILTGSFVIERIFTIPGLGRQFVESITNRDYTAILGVTIFYSAFLIICNLIVDILYGFVDPRIRFEEQEV